jgi:photosystem II stability/assembly factor-like uncharacterized protein
MEINHRLLLQSLFLFILLSLYIPAKSQWQFLGSPEGCNSVDFDSEGDTMVLLTDGGIFYSVDTGALWRPIEFPQESYKLEYIQVEHGSLYVTASHWVKKNDKSNELFEVYRSDDWGSTWHYLTGTLNDQDNFRQSLVKSDTFYFIDRYNIYVSYDKGDHYSVIAPSLGDYGHYYLHHHRLFASVRISEHDALLRSDDDGQTWDTLYIAIGESYIENVNSIDGALWKIEHFMPGHLCWVSKSVDDGETWNNTGTIFNLLVGFFDLEPRKIIGHTNQLYMIGEYTAHYIYYSSDGGATWARTVELGSVKDAFYGYGLLFFTNVKSFQKSSEHGANLQPITNGIKSFSVNNIASTSSSLWVHNNYSEGCMLEGAQDWQVHDSIDDVEATRNGTLLATINHKPYRSLNNGLDWIPIPAEELGYSSGWPVNAYNIMCAGDVMGITVSSNELYYSIDDGEHWHDSGLNYGYWLTYNEKYILNVSFDVVVSDNGIAWDTIPIPSHPEYHFWPDCVYWLDPYYFMGSGDLLLRLHQDSSVWEKVEIPDPGIQGPPISLNSYGNALLVTVYGGGVFSSENFGDSWEPLNDGLTNLRAITLSKDEENLYLGVNNGIWKRPLNELTVSTDRIEKIPYDYVSTIISHGELSIDLPGGSYDQFYARLYSCDGEMMFQKQLQGPHFEFDLEGYPSGLYYLSLTSSDDHVIRRVLKVE